MNLEETLGTRQKILCLFGYLFNPIRLDHKFLRARKTQVEGASNCKEPEVKHKKMVLLNNAA